MLVKTSILSVSLNFLLLDSVFKHIFIKLKLPSFDQYLLTVLVMLFTGSLCELSKPSMLIIHNTCGGKIFWSHSSEKLTFNKSSSRSVRLATHVTGSVLMSIYLVTSDLSGVRSNHYVTVAHSSCKNAFCFNRNIIEDNGQ